MAITNKEEWLKDMPERIMLLLLLKREGLSSEQIDDELGENHPARKDTIISSIHCLCRNELINAVNKRTSGGLQIVYELSEKSFAEIGEMVDRARIERKAKYN